MTCIKTAIHVERPIDQVFEFVTTPGNWPSWHPSSLGVSGATEHSLAPGEQVTEEFLVAGRRGRVTWTVRRREAPHRWVIEGRVHGGGGGTITYTMADDAGGTSFEREFVYTTRSVMHWVLDLMIIRRRIIAESAEALRRVKRLLEQRGRSPQACSPGGDAW